VSLAPLPPSYLPPLTQPSGRFIAVEGVSGAGKSTVVKLLAERLGAEHLHVMPAPYSYTTRVNDELLPFPQLAYYLSGLMHAGDLVRETITTTGMVTDRYAISVIANHAAVYQLPLDAVNLFARPLLAYLPVPEVTVYLRTSAPTIRARMRHKIDITGNDKQLLAISGLLERVLDHYDTLLAADDSGLWVETDRTSPEQIVEYVLAYLNGGDDDQD
jgi:thymidylate kinase